MRRLLNALIPAAALLALPGCVSHTFAPGPGMTTASYEPDAALCRLIARGVDPASTSGVGTAVRANVNFNDCMQARGWRVVDNVLPAARGLSGVVATQDLPPPPPPPRRTLGIRSTNVTDSLAYSSQLDPPRGVIVMSVMQDGAAAAAGLLPGDVILSFGDTSLKSIADLQRALATTPANSTVQARIWRDRQELATDLQF